MAFTEVQAWQVMSGKNVLDVVTSIPAAHAVAELWYPNNPTDTYYFEVVKLVEE